MESNAGNLNDEVHQINKITNYTFKYYHKYTIVNSI